MRVELEVMLWWLTGAGDRNVGFKSEWLCDLYVVLVVVSDSVSSREQSFSRLIICERR